MRSYVNRFFLLKEDKMGLIKETEKYLQEVFNKLGYDVGKNLVIFKLMMLLHLLKNIMKIHVL